MTNLTNEENLALAEKNHAFSAEMEQCLKALESEGTIPTVSSVLAQTGRPDIDAFKTNEEFLEALVDWKLAILAKVQLRNESVLFSACKKLVSKLNEMTDLVALLAKEGSGGYEN